MPRTTSDYNWISIKKFKDRWCLENWWQCAWGLFFPNGRRKSGDMQYCMHLHHDRPYIKMVFKMRGKGEKEWQPLDYKIYLSKTPCNLWWYRYRFLCPCTGRRCVKLYLQNNGIFCDRVAMWLSYPKQMMSHYERLLEPPMYQYELDRLWSSIKVHYRNGRQTRKYNRYIRNTNKLYNVIRVLARHQEKRISERGLESLL